MAAPPAPPWATGHAELARTREMPSIGNWRLTPRRRAIPGVAMPTIYDALDAFLQEHGRCGELDNGIEDELGWMTCSCGAALAQAPAGTAGAVADPA